MPVPKGTRVGGRQKGTPNKSTAEIKALAQKHGPAALATLVKLMDTAQSEQAKVAAAKELLDRGYGKSTQPHAGDPEGAPIKHDHRHGLGWMTEAQAKGRGWA